MTTSAGRGGEREEASSTPGGAVRRLWAAGAVGMTVGLLAHDVGLGLEAAALALAVADGRR